jgi:restriction system protein
VARRRTSPLEDFVDVVSKFPWWVGVGLALVSFIVLRGMAGADLVVNPREMGSFMPRMMVKAFANVGQWLLPVAWLGGALFSYLKQRQRNQLHADASSQRATAGVAAMSWQDFERLVGEYFRRRGFSVEETGARAADGGVDVVLTRGSDRYLVQCKHWKALRVGVEPARELYGVMAACRAAGGFLVTSGQFTAEAKRFAEGRELELIDGVALQAALRRQAGDPVKQRDARAVAAAMPSCPLCKSEMVLRVNKKGHFAGQEFWGCSSFPTCRGTRPAHA